ncbi:MAG: C39 family peptidase [Chloroflexi bacterium]|nr:C39 family peptidase [Chloroflexota bacterium]
MTEQTHDILRTPLPDNAELESFREQPSAEDTDRIRPVYPRRKKPSLFGLLARTIVSVGAGSFGFALVAGVVLAIIIPPWYRSLQPRYQEIWCHRISALCEFKKKAPEGDILVFQGDTSDALALLNEDTPTPTVTIAPEISLTSNEPTSTPIPPKSGGGGTGEAIPTEAPVEVLPTATLEPTALPTATPVPVPLSDKLDLTKIHWEQQGWNNCGPTTVTIALSYFGYSATQTRAADFLKPNIEDKNVSPSQLVEFVNTDAANDVSVRALYRIGGTLDLLKHFIAADFPVIIERGINVRDAGWMGHYSLVVGYDDAEGDLYLFDSYFGSNKNQGRPERQDSIELGWKQFNYTYIVLYDPSREAELREVLANYADPAYAANDAFERARQAATLDPDDKFAWFNMGTALTLLGRYDEAVLAYNRARTLDLPYRIWWYQFGPYIAYYQAGQYNEVITIADTTESNQTYIEEIYYYRGLAYAAENKPEDAVKEFDKALRYNKNFTKADEAKQEVLEGRFVAPR